MIRKKILSAVCAIAISFGCFTAAPGAFGFDNNGITADAYYDNTSGLPVERIAGMNRYETAQACSRAAYPNGSENVVLAYGSNYADALCGVPLAKLVDAPILLTTKDTLSEANLYEIQRLGAKNVYLLGGKGVISEKIEKSLKDSKYNVVRVAGSNRFGTSAQIAKTMQDIQTPESEKQTETQQSQTTQPVNGTSAQPTATSSTKTTSATSAGTAQATTTTKTSSTSAAVSDDKTEAAKKISTTAFFVCANTFPDALSVSSVAALTDSPIFYVNNSGKLDAAVKEYLDKCGIKFEKAYIIGGELAIGKAITEELKPYFKTTERIGGANRYDTNILVNTAFAKLFTSKDIYLATGKDFPDALAGGVNAAKHGSPLLLADGEISKTQLDYLTKYGIDPKGSNILYVLGGSGVVSEETVKSVLMMKDHDISIINYGTKMKLSWTADDKASAYEIYRDGKLIKTIKDLKVTEFTDTGLNAAKDYEYSVRYVFGTGQDALSQTESMMSSDYNAVLNSVPDGQKYVLKTENAQGTKSTFSSYDIRLLKTKDWATLEKFAKEHFTKNMTKADKVAYTLNWINKNVWYGTVQDGGWAKLLAMVSNGTFSYVNCIFNYKIGQCNCYNGALASMMLYLGYDAHLVMGYRGAADDKGKITKKWQHFWCEVVINGQTYVMEAGNYGEDGDWMYICERYRYVDSPTYGYIKNGKVVMT